MDYKNVFQSECYKDTEDVDRCRRYYEEHDSYHLKKIRPEILNLKTRGDVCIYIEENIIQTNFTTKFSKAELVYLFRCLGSVSPHPAMTIIDLKYKLRDYVHNAIRTADLIKNSCYWWYPSNKGYHTKGLSNKSPT